MEMSRTCYKNMRVRQSMLLVSIVTIVLSFHLSLRDVDSKLIYISPLSTDCGFQYKPCLDLNEVAESDLHLQDNVSLVFLPGAHIFFREFTTSNISDISLLASGSFQQEASHVVNISCYRNARFKFSNVSLVLIQGLNFRGCGNNEFRSIEGLSILNCTFEGRNGTGTSLDIKESHVNISHSQFVMNTVGKCRIFPKFSFANHCVPALVGGAIYAAKHCNIHISHSHFLYNSAERGGAIFSACHNNITIYESRFVNNSVVLADGDVKDSHCSLQNNGPPYRSIVDDCYETDVMSCTAMSEFESRSANGGVMTSLQSLISVEESVFMNNTNKAAGSSGVLWIDESPTLTIKNSKFSNNHALNRFGGVLTASGPTNIMIVNCTISKSSSQQGGALKIEGARVVIQNSTFIHNVASEMGGVITVAQHSNLHLILSRFTNNSVNCNGSLRRTCAGGAIYAVIHAKVVVENCEFIDNHADHYGGSMAISQSTLIFNGSRSAIQNNSANMGGAMYVAESFVHMYNRTDVVSNIAHASGGGIYLYKSELNCMQGCTLNITGNRANSTGGGIHAINSLITAFHNRSSEIPFDTSIAFVRNRASKGGGLFLQSAAQLRVQKTGAKFTTNTTEISFEYNSADYHGEAIYVWDETYFDICSRGMNTSETAPITGCFIQVLSPQLTVDHKYQTHSVKFVLGNESRPNSSVIFGGLLDRCTLDAHAEIRVKYQNTVEGDGATYLRNISNIKVRDFRHIRSEPIRLSLCSNDVEPNCNITSNNVHCQVMKGHQFNLPLVAVDQVNNTVDNVTVFSFLQHSESGLGLGQLTQTTGISCTRLNFSVTSPHSTEVLILYAEGPCRNSTRSQLRLNITFLPCTCDKSGFQPKESNNDSVSCECVCNKWLTTHSWVTEDGCNYQTGSLTKKGNPWIAYNSSTRSFIMYRYCPFDYCRRGKNITVNLNKGNGSDDSQCANNRSGILCGECRPGFSLSLGSSRCLKCSETTYKLFIAIVIAALLIGIALVTFLMILNLTVATGTLNGVILYANILGAGGDAVFSPSSKFPSIIISWLNLEVGFDVCFFEGMDTYWKTWLQLAFPSYVILLVLLIIIISEHSMTFSRLIAKRNPVATLATLILLSYTKFLQTTITVLLPAKLKYSDGCRWVWFADGNVQYARGKHIILVVAAVFILILGIAYTSLLFFWQWILPHQNKWLFKWARSQRLSHFLEPYHAPYNFEHRYWTGLLLFARVILYLAFSLNVLGEPAVSVGAIALIVNCLVFLRALTGRYYKKKIVDWIEMTCLFNASIFSAFQLCNLTVQNQQRRIARISFASYVTFVVTIILILAIVVHCIWIEFISHCFKQCKRSSNPGWDLDEDNERFVNYLPESLNGDNLAKPTSSSVVFRPKLMSSRSATISRNDHSLDPSHYDTDEDLSADSSAPLMDGHLD